MRLIAVMDCCHSGTGLDLPFVCKHDGWVVDGNKNKVPVLSLGDVRLFSGCRDDQVSREVRVFSPFGVIGAIARAFGLESGSALTTASRRAAARPSGAAS